MQQNRLAEIQKIIDTLLNNAPRNRERQTMIIMNSDIAKPHHSLQRIGARRVESAGARATQRAIVAALLISTSPAINQPARRNVRQQTRTRRIQLRRLTQHRHLPNADLCRAANTHPRALTHSQNLNLFRREAVAAIVSQHVLFDYVADLPVEAIPPRRHVVTTIPVEPLPQPNAKSIGTRVTQPLN